MGIQRPAYISRWLKKKKGGFCGCFFVLKKLFQLSFQSHLPLWGLHAAVRLRCFVANIWCTFFGCLTGLKDILFWKAFIPNTSFFFFLMFIWPVQWCATTAALWCSMLIWRCIKNLVSGEAPMIHSARSRCYRCQSKNYFPVSDSQENTSLFFLLSLILDDAQSRSLSLIITRCLTVTLALCFTC